MVDLKLVLFRWFARRFARMSASARLRWAQRLMPVIKPLIKKRRKIMARNIALCFPEMTAAERETLLNASLVANAKGVLDGLHAWYAPTFDIEDNYRLVDEAHLLAAFEKGEGVVVLCAHYPGGEQHMRMVRQLSGVSILPMVRAFRNIALDDEVNAQRTQHLGGVIARDDVRGFTAAVRRGDGTFYAPDVNVRTRNVFVPFFGVQASTLDSMSVILRRAGGAVIPGWAKPLPDGRYEVTFESPWADFPSKDGAADALRFTQWVESKLRECPEAYDWGTKRFKTRPSGEVDLYA